MKKKVLENKKKKEENLLKAAFDLLSCKDIQDVSVDEIVGKAGIAKGTFYLYYKDKYAIRDALIQKESTSLFTQAFDQLHKNDIRSFEDSVVFVINHVLMQLENNLPILRFIQRNLSYGLLHSRLKKAMDEDTYDIFDDFRQRAEASGYHYEKPEVILYMVVELAGSTCYNAILSDDPLPMEQYKPYLFNAIRSILHSGSQ